MRYVLIIRETQTIISEIVCWGCYHLAVKINNGWIKLDKPTRNKNVRILTISNE